MSFEEFIKYIHEREQKKLYELVAEKNKASEEYEQLLNLFRNLKEPFFKKENPALYFIVGGGIALIIGVLCIVLTRSFPKIPSGTFVIPSAFLATIFGYGGYSIYKQNKYTKGQPTKGYLDYEDEKDRLWKQLTNLRKLLNDYQMGISDFRFVIKDSDIELAKECYLYLIDFETKKKKININERTLDNLLENSSLAVILYKYFNDELEQYQKLSYYERIKCKVEIERKIAKVKAYLEEELRKQAKAKESEDIHETKKEQETMSVPYQRIRRTVRNRTNYSDKLIDVNEANEGHHR